MRACFWVGATTRRYQELAYRRHRRRIARAALVGSVGFRIGAVSEQVTLDRRHGWAIFDLPPVRAHSRIVATFTGNGRLAPSHAAHQSPVASTNVARWLADATPRPR